VDSWLLAIGSAVWLGVLTSVSPCPLATNVVAITYLGRRVDRPRHVVISGLLYTLGRTVTYVLLGILIISGLLAIPELSLFLQENINKVLGPALLLIGLILLGVIPVRISGPGLGESFQKRMEKLGFWGAAVMGIAFALSFCPVSAALFFGSLIPLSLERESSLLMPSLYGIGTAIPVVIFAIAIGLGAGFVGKMFNALTAFERWARRITGVAAAASGVYLTLIYWFAVQLW